MYHSCHEMSNWNPLSGEGQASTGSIGCDGAQLNSQGVASLPVVLHSMVVAPAAVKVSPATEDGAVCQVEPQVLFHVTLGALPATGPGRRK